MNSIRHSSIRYSTMKTQSSNCLVPRALWAAFGLTVMLAFFGPAAQAADANPPAQLSYQGYLTDANGVPLGSTTPRNYDVVFRIYDASQGGNIKWAEQQTITVDKGYFTVMLGEGSAVGSEPRPSLAAVFTGADASDRYIGITVKGLAATDVEIAPRLRLLTSPYAFLAKNALAIVSNAGDTILSAGTGSVGIKTATPAAELDVNGTVKATAFVGGGAQLSGINAANLTTGTLPNARISSDIARRTEANTFTANNTFNGAVSVGSKVEVNGAVYARGGAPGGVNVNNNGFAFKNNSGDNDSGMFSTADGRVSLYANNSEILRVTGTGASLSGAMSASGTVTAGMFSGPGTIPIGGIIMWSGTIAEIPAGWALCDGGTYNSKLTPDLRDRFVVGAGSSYAPKATGGANSVTLSTSQIPSHYHSMTDYYHAESSDRGVDYYGYVSTSRVGSGDSDSDNKYLFYYSHNTGATGSGGAHENRPPYYAMAFIMRVQ